MHVFYRREHGEDQIVKYLDPILKSISPGVDAAPRTPGREGPAAPVEHGYLHCGQTGAGHFVKMVHNGIEYGVMAAYAEGLNILKSANAGKRTDDADAETAPLHNPEFYQYDLELARLGATAKIEPDLAEWDYGDYEGLRAVDICMQQAHWNIFQDGCPHGEMPAQVAARADRLIAHLRTLKGNVALFSHGQFGRVLAARWIGLPPIEAQHLLLDTAAVSILAHDPLHPKMAVIALWNVPAHEMFDSALGPT